jgi:hypothetical protein
MIARTDQCRRNAQPVVVPSHRALDQVVRAEILADLLRRLARMLVRHARRSADDAQTVRGHPAQRTDQRLGHAVGEVLVGCVAARVLER